MPSPTSRCTLAVNRASQRVLEQSARLVNSSLLASRMEAVSSHTRPRRQLWPRGGARQHQVATPPHSDSAARSLSIAIAMGGTNSACIETVRFSSVGKIREGQGPVDIRRQVESDTGLGLVGPLDRISPGWIRKPVVCADCYLPPRRAAEVFNFKRARCKRCGGAAADMRDRVRRRNRRQDLPESEAAVRVGRGAGHQAGLSVVNPRVPHAASPAIARKRGRGSHLTGVCAAQTLTSHTSLRRYRNAFFAGDPRLTLAILGQRSRGMEAPWPHVHANPH